MFKSYTYLPFQDIQLTVKPTSHLLKHLKIIFDEKEITSVQFNTWIGTDRFKVTTPVRPFLDEMKDSCLHRSPASSIF